MNRLDLREAGLRPRLALAWIAMGACVAGLFALAVWERQSLIREGFWRDEAAAVYVARSGSVGDFMDRQLKTEYTPPLFNVVLAGYARAAGFGETSLKRFALVLGLSAISAIGALAWKAFGSAACLPAIILAAGNPILFPLSAELRPYSMSVGLAAVSLLVAHRIAIREASPNRNVGLLPVLLGVCLTLVAYSHVAGVLVVVGIGITGAALLRGRRARWGRGILVPAVVAGVLFLPWLPTTLHQAHAGLPYESSLTLAQRGATLARRLVLGGPTNGAPAAFLAVIAISALALVRSARFREEVREHRVGFVLVLCVAVGVAVPLGLFSVTDRYMAVPVALACVAAAGLIAAAWRAAGLGSAPTRRLVRLGLTVALALVLWAGREPGDRLDSDLRRGRPKSGIRTLCAPRDMGGQDLIVIAPDYLASTFWYYCGEQPGMRGLLLSKEPMMVNWQDYGRRWADPAMIPRALERISEDIEALKPTRLVLVGDISSNGPPLYYTARIERLRRALRARLGTASSETFDGRLESVLVDVFAIAPKPASKRGAQESSPARESGRSKRTGSRRPPIIAPS